ncbi:related to nitrate assimilation regulatory protein nirA [Rhynchosporium agropyri]|uniref:Related to nitrate assimilation regulatory protein nirA n=1 Tax=Rhynchosporium agropyri TaxID=914238 RepID=A0A1E1LJ63_9HELO|nr:related to nitrate assimilation regulatory protein nirA [Rhynchosporium agropyri]
MDSASNSKRRRGLGVVTANACTECRKKRAKCDGKTPCGRCTSQNADCQYEMPVRQSKEEMRSEIETLRTHKRANDRVLAALVSGDASDNVLDQLRRGEAVETIVDRLDDSQSSMSSMSGSNITTSYARPGDRKTIGGALSQARSIVSSPLSLVGYSPAEGSTTQSQGRAEGTAWPTWGGGNVSATQEAETADQGDAMVWDVEPLSYPQQALLGGPLIDNWPRRSESDPASQSERQEARGFGQATILGSTFGMEELPEQHSLNKNQSWTTVTTDGAFVEHLMALYFCWEYPTFASLNKEHFLEDMRAGYPRYCSSLLVNALLAVGCRFSKQPHSRTDPDDSNTAGDHFFAEATRLLEMETDHHSLTTIQALGLLSIREASCGRSSHSIFLAGQSIRLAIEMGLHFDNQDGRSETAKLDHAVRSATFWGAFSLDQVWSLCIGRLPYFSRNAKLVTKPPIVEHIEVTAWVPYTDNGAPLDTPCTQPSNVRSVYKTFCELSEIVHKSLYMLYTPGKPVTSKSLNDVYTEYIRWYSEIPETLRLGHNFTPAVLFAHMYYHTAILLLFRPFVKLKITGSGVSPRDLCAQAANTISVLLKSYSKLYTLQRTPSFVPYFVLASTITHAMTLGNSQAGPEHLQQAIADLREMASCHAFAGRAVDIINFLIGRWDIAFEILGADDDNESKNKSNSNSNSSNGDEIGNKKDAFDLENLCKSKSSSMNLFSPNMYSTDTVPNGIGIVPEGGDPIFWLFPMQGRPMLDSVGDELGKAGFDLQTD